MNEDILSLSGNLFTFESTGCECLIDTTHEEDGKLIQTLRIKGDESRVVKFAYMPQKGLVTINSKTGAILEKDVLGILLAVPTNDVEKIEQFFSTYGFLIPISSRKFETFPMASISLLLQRIKFTVELLSMLQAPRKNYFTILSRVCWLIFMQPVSLSVSDGKDGYESCIHSFLRYERDADQLSGDDQRFLDGNIYYGDPTEIGYHIPDSISPPETYISLIEYCDITQSSEESELYDTTGDIIQGPIITKMFKELTDIPKAERTEIEFFYHLRKMFGPLKSIDDNGNLHFNKSTAALKEDWKKYFNDNMKSALIDVAKLVVKEEIDEALYAIAPAYDTEHMGPAWYIPDLMSGLYFSLFYLKSDVEIYRNCANPNCGRPFLVSTTNSRRKYCCPECANAMAQRKYRKRKKEQASN